MPQARRLFSFVDDAGHQLVVGVEIRHPSLGMGTLVSGWEGHVEVLFATGKVRISESDGLCLVRSNDASEWLLLPQPEVDAWVEQCRRQRLTALARVRAAFHADFINCDSVFSSIASNQLSRSEYEQEKLAFVQDWIKRNLPSVGGAAGKLPDLQQALAISTVVGHVLVAARAGSGKTETIANRAVFLQKHCGVDPDEMLLLAFNIKAAQEMSHRIAGKLGDATLPHIMHFHALAAALVQGKKDLLKNTSGGEQGLNQVHQDVVLDAMRNPEFEGRVRRIMLKHFRSDWETILDSGFKLSWREMLQHRRNLICETLRGEYVKSFGEKVIANFLFEHDIPYQYERPHTWNGRTYRPDFTVSKYGDMAKGVVIEYFGMEGDPEYDEQSEEKREFWRSRDKAKDWEFIELSKRHMEDGGLSAIRYVEQELTAAKVRVSKLSEDEIWQRAKDRVILNFTKAVSGFTGRCRKQWITPEMLGQLIARHSASCGTETEFLGLAVEHYALYLERLEAIEAEDFDGLLQDAVNTIMGGKSRFNRKGRDGDLLQTRYLFIDEYQDFSELFHRLIAAIRHLNPQMEVFCVGDDWQAINRFAGSDLKFYRDFSTYFRPAQSLKLSTNRRSMGGIIDVSNALMHSRGTPAQAAGINAGKVGLVDLDKFKPTKIETSQFKGHLAPAVLRIVGKALGQGKSVVLLSSKNSLSVPGSGSVSMERYLKYLKQRLPVPMRDGLSKSTVHSFKGRESDVVILLDAFAGSFPMFHPNWVFSRILGEGIEEIIDESRRLFYVALTRAKEQLYIITEKGRESMFLTEIIRRVPLSSIDWMQYPSLHARADWLIVKVAGSYSAMDPLRGLLKTDAFEYRDLSSSGGDKSWERSFRFSELDDSFLVKSPWMTHAGELGTTGVEVRLFDGMEERLMSCKILNGKLFMPSNMGTYEEFSLSKLSAFLSGTEPTTGEFSDVPMPY